MMKTLDILSVIAKQRGISLPNLIKVMGGSNTAWYHRINKGLLNIRDIQMLDEQLKLTEAEISRIVRSEIYKA